MRARDFIPALDLNYSVFGMLLRSSAALPGVAPIPSTATSPDLELHLGVSPYSEKEVSPDQEELTYVSSYCAETGEPALRIWQVAKDAFLRIAYFDGTQFWLDRKRENLWVRWPARSSLEETLTYLLGPILGLLLRLRGVTCLHASAVAIEDHCLAFVGPEGAGKSTTAAAFALQGYGVLSDDIVALAERDGTFQVMRAYPHLCLWPDSVQMLYGSSEALPRFIQDWDKRRLARGDRGTRFESRALPLGAIYLLGDRTPDLLPYVEAMPSQSALLALVAGSFASTILDRDMRGREFEVLGRLVTTVPVRRIRPSNDSARLGELCQVICEDFATLGFPAPAQP